MLHIEHDDDDAYEDHLVGLNCSLETFEGRLLLMIEVVRKKETSQMVVYFLPYHWLAVAVDVVDDFSLYLRDDISRADWKTKLECVLRQD